MILAIKNARFCHTLLPDFAIKNCLNLLGKVVGDGGQEHGQQHQTAQGGQNPHEAGDGRSTWIYWGSRCPDEADLDDEGADLGYIRPSNANATI